MLLVLSGPSCAGKSTIMTILRNRGVNQIRTFTTRSKREDDVYRDAVDKEFILSGKRSGELCQVRKIFGELYAISASDIKISQTTYGLWMLDFDYNSLDRLSSLNFALSLVVPESEDALRFRIREAGRADRMHKALLDYHLILNTEKYPIADQDLGRLFVNTHKREESCAVAILNFATALSRSC